jgi:hypothetical protein
MTSLEILVLTTFALLIIFAALPYVVNTLYASMAPLEYRTAAGYILSFADALEADVGMAGARKYFNLPSFVYGSFGAVNKTYVFTITCGSKRFVWNSAEVWYNSSYLVGFPRLLRGLSDELVVIYPPPGRGPEPPDTLVAVQSGDRWIRMWFRLFIVNGTDEKYIYVINATVRVMGGVPQYLYYTVWKIERHEIPNCYSGRLVIGSREVPFDKHPRTANIYIVTQYVNITLR